MTEAGEKWDRRWKPEDDEPRPRRDRHGALLGATSAEQEGEAESDGGPDAESVAEDPGS